MAVTYENSAANYIKDERMGVVRDQIDAGTGAGKLVIGTSGFATTLVTITLNDPCGTVATGSGALSFDVTPNPEGTAGAPGTAAEARITDSDDNIVISGLTVSTTGADINLNNTSIQATDTVSLTSGTITHG